MEAKLREKEGIENINLDTVADLNLYNKEGYYNIAAELLADTNNIEHAGLDIVVYGKDGVQILYREIFSKKSLLAQYDRAVEIFKRYYQYEEISGKQIIKRELIPEEAFRGSLVYAILNRALDIYLYIQVNMYEDRIEIIIPGGLPASISDDESFYSDIILLQNPVIAGVFYRLGIVKKFESSVTGIKRVYKGSLTETEFRIFKDSICIVLPLIEINKSSLSEEELFLLDILKEGIELSRQEIEEKTGYNRMKTIRRLNRLLEKDLIEKLGKGPGTTYRQKKPGKKQHKKRFIDN